MFLAVLYVSIVLGLVRNFLYAIIIDFKWNIGIELGLVRNFLYAIILRKDGIHTLLLGLVRNFLYAIISSCGRYRPSGAGACKEFFICYNSKRVESVNSRMKRSFRM